MSPEDFDQISGRLDALTRKLALVPEDVRVDAHRDLTSQGIDSLARLSLLLGIETELGFEFPEELLAEENFCSLAAIADTTLKALTGT